MAQRLSSSQTRSLAHYIWCSRVFESGVVMQLTFGVAAQHLVWLILGLVHVA